MLQFVCQAFASTNDVLNAPCGCSWTEDDIQLVVEAIEQASDLLYILSHGRVTGRCTHTVTVIGDSACGIVGSDPFPEPAGWAVAYGAGAIPLRGPQTSVVEVAVDNAPLDQTDYGLKDNHVLYPVAGYWPEGSMEITYQFGYPVDFLTKTATVELACELLTYYSGETTRLPPGVISANIQSAAVNLRDAQNSGLSEVVPAVARFLGLHSYDGNYPSQVWFPEMRMGKQLIQVEGPSGS